MARPKKSRCICSYPDVIEFYPTKKFSEKINMTVDEYETIRLIDSLGFNQEECAKQMDVARSTVATIYLSAREKIADAIVHGKGLVIEGGDIAVCENSGHCCGECGKNQCGHCDHGTCLNCKHSDDSDNCKKQ